MGVFTLILIVLGFFLIWKVISCSVRFIPNDRIGIVEKRTGKKIREGNFIALQGERGFQPQILRGGLHFLTPLMNIHTAEFIKIPYGTIGYVFARDGQPCGHAQTLASNLYANDFQDTEAFLCNGGQKGIQRIILREGVYAINLAQFTVITGEKIYSLPLGIQEEQMMNNMAIEIAGRDGFHPVTIRDEDDMIGIVTVHDGPPVSEGESVAPVVGNDPANPETYHNNFQDPDKFLQAGGMMGRQLQVIVEGTYYINRLFATVEMIPKTTIPNGYVGVVVSYISFIGKDSTESSAGYKHREIVERGAIGVWNEALFPGKYAFNTYAGAALIVPNKNVPSNSTGVSEGEDSDFLKDISINSDPKVFYKEVIKYYDTEPEYEWLWLLARGLLLHNTQGKYEEAIICYDKVLELRPGDEYALANRDRAVIFAGSGNGD